MSRITSALIIFTLGLLCSQRSQAGYLANASASFYYDGFTTPFQHVANTNQSPVSAHLATSIGGTTAAVDTAAEFNRVHIRLASIGTSTSNTPIQVEGLAEWNDSLFFSRSGVDVLSGSLKIAGHVEGTVATEGLNIKPLSPLHVWLSFEVGHERGGGGTVFVQSGSYDDFSTNWSNTYSWSATDGVGIRVLIGGYVKDGESPSSVMADLSAYIANVIYLGPDGNPDPSVTITSASGIVYGVPEPSGWLLAMAESPALSGIGGHTSASHRVDFSVG